MGSENDRKGGSEVLLQSYTQPLPRSGIIGSTRAHSSTSEFAEFLLMKLQVWTEAMRTQCLEETRPRWLCHGFRSGKSRRGTNLTTNASAAGDSYPMWP